MVEIRNCSEKQLNSWRPSRLGAYYMNTYLIMNQGSNSHAEEELKKTEKVMRGKSLEDNVYLLKEIERQKFQFRISGNNEEARIRTQMEKRFYDNVLYDSLK